MTRRPVLTMVAGAVLVAASGAAVAVASGERFVAPLEAEAQGALAQAGGREVVARFHDRFGWPTRHALLSGGEALPDETRAAAAQAVAAVGGVGGVHWTGASRRGKSQPVPASLHCQQDVEGLLKTRTVRFQEGSAALLPASGLLLGEVAAALEPCQGAIIAITGHTDRSGDEAENLSLSLARARTVREALVRRGIPRASLRARGLGSEEPTEGLTPEDPANRRIEFSVIRKTPLSPTPVDTPQAY